MKKDILNKLFLVFIGIILFSCSAKKAVLKPTIPTVKTNTNKENKLLAINAAQFNFNTLSIKAKADLTFGNNSNDVSMNIRIKKNEIIWVSITAIAGLEVARALITPDSIKILNRFESTYTKKPFKYIYEFTNDQIKFSTLQSILIGNVISEALNGKSELLLQGNQSSLSGLLNTLSYHIHLNEQNKVIQSNFKDEKAGQMLNVNYADFLAVTGTTIPHAVNLKSQASRKNLEINLKYTRVNMNEALDYPFSVPSRFTIKN